MSKLHEALCKGFPDMDFIALREWSNERGEMGVYHETSDGTLYVGDGYSIAILLSDGRMFYDHFTHGAAKTIIEDVTLIAVFAGAQEQ